MSNKTEEAYKKKSKVREYIEAILTAVLIALFIRSFIIEAFKIPSPSMVPTLMVGDHIFVNKFIYGIRIPLTKKWLVKFQEPKHGDVVVFLYPRDESKNYIKRVVGVPGDSIKIENTKVFVNGEELKQQRLTAKQGIEGKFVDLMGADEFSKIPYYNGWWFYTFFEESAEAGKYIVQYETDQFRSNFELKVPEEHLFVMGDNRDNSQDSRVWGFVPMENLKGKAMFVWMSLNHDEGNIRFNRFGKWIK